MGRWWKANRDRVRKEQADILNQDEPKVVPLANRNGLYVLFSGKPGQHRQWKIYDRESGRTLATYWPQDKRLVFHFGPLQAVRVAEPDHERVMARIRERLAEHPVRQFFPLSTS